MSGLEVPGPDPTANQLLAALPEQERGRLQPHLELVPLTAQTVLLNPGEPITYAYFPTSGVLSLLAVPTRGHGVEVGVVGREGLVGLPLLLGTDRSPSRCLVQIPGSAFRVPAAAFRDQACQDGPLHQLLLRYTHALLAQVSQSVVCGALHSVEKRLCRWLLMMRSRVDGDDLSLTHQFLASLLGVRRASVTKAARDLQEKGLIRTSRGQVTVLNRRRLERAACDCYRVVQAEWDRVFG